MVTNNRHHFFVLVLVLCCSATLVALATADQAASSFTSELLSEKARFEMFDPYRVMDNGNFPGQPQMSFSNPTYMQINPDGRIHKISGLVALSELEGVRKQDMNPHLVALEQESSKTKFHSRFKTQSQSTSTLETEGQVEAKVKYHVVNGSTTYKHVSNVNYPRSAIGCYRLNASPNFCCTAWRVGRGKNIVITAGHCVYNQGTETFRPFADTAFVPSYDTTHGPRPPRPNPVVKVYIDGRFYKPTKDWRYDWAILVLRDDLEPESTGTFGLKVPPQLPTNVFTAGYPQTHPGQMWEDHCSMKSNADPIMGDMDMCSAVGGQSGSPVFLADNYAVAILDWSGTTVQTWFVMEYVIGFVQEAIRTGGTIASAVPP